MQLATPTDRRTLLVREQARCQWKKSRGLPKTTPPALSRERTVAPPASPSDVSGGDGPIDKIEEEFE
jgi:hypothetical protein